MARDDMTVRCAIEICMSRLQMWPQVKSYMAIELDAHINRNEPQPPQDVDGLRASFMVISDLCSGIDTTWSKPQMINRIQMIREHADRSAPKPTQDTLL